MNKSYKIRLYPTKEQETLICKTFGCVRKVWNILLSNNVKGREEYKTNWRQDYNTKTVKNELSFMEEVSAAALQQKARDLKQTYHQWFKSNKGERRGSKLGHPKFKKKGVKDSYRLPSGKFNVLQQEGLIRLEKIGKVRCRYPTPIPKGVKLVSVTVTRTSCGKLYASVLTEQEIKRLPKTGKKVGVDLGIKDLMTLSNGYVIKNPKYLRESQSKIIRIQRTLSRKEKGSARYNKCKKKLAKLYYKVSRQREWYIHNVTKALVRDYDFISVETLVNYAMRSEYKSINRALKDTSLYEVVRQLSYKCNWYGKTLVKVDRWFPSSQVCNICSSKCKEVSDLSVRKWSCYSCGAVHQRDHNAAINILKQGFKDSSGESLDYKRGDFINTFNYNKELNNFVEALTITQGTV